MNNENIKWLENWFFQNCDENWDKEKIFIETIDNPGWLLTFKLIKSSYENKTLDKMIERTEEDWIDCIIKNNKLTIAGGPFNLSEIIHYFRNWVEDKNEDRIVEDEMINWMQDWYYEHCDGDWEHEGRFRIKTVNDVGWHFSMNVNETHCEDKIFDEIEVKSNETDWYKCFVEKNDFQGYGGIFNLLDILKEFRKWAEE